MTTNYDNELAALLAENAEGKLPPVGRFNVDIDSAVWSFSKAGDPMLTVAGTIVSPTSIGRKVFHRVGLWSKARASGAAGLNELALAVEYNPADLYRTAVELSQGVVQLETANADQAGLAGTAINMVVTHRSKTEKDPLGATSTVKDAQIKVLPYEYIESA